MGKRLFSWLSLILVTALLITGCSPAATPAPMRGPLRVEYTIWEGDYTLLIAQEKGFFSKHGVAVEPVFYGTFSQAIPDLGGNKIDGGLFAIGDALTVNRAANVKGVMVYDSGGTSAVVAQKDIASIADLKGKKIGVTTGTYTELFVREMLQSEGMLARDVTFVNVDPEQVSDRINDGEIAAGYVWAPYDQRAVEAGHKILYSRSATASLFPDLVVFREDVVNARPADIKAFTAAWFEALEYRQAHPDECNQIIAKLTNQKVEDVASTGDLKLFSRADNLQLFDKSSSNKSSIYYAAQVNLDFQVSNGGVTYKPDLNKILDPSFLQ